MENELRADADKLKGGLRLIRQMKTDIMLALAGGTQLVVEGEGPLNALMTVVEVAEQATAKELIPLVGRIPAENEDTWRCIVCVDFDGVILESVDVKGWAFGQIFAGYPDHGFFFG